MNNHHHHHSDEAISTQRYSLQELDQEIARHDTMFITEEKVNLGLKPERKPLFRRIFDRLRIPPLPLPLPLPSSPSSSASSSSQNNQSNDTGSRMEFITCRICENECLSLEVDDHTNKCVLINECLTQLDTYAHYINCLKEEIKNSYPNIFGSKELLECLTNVEITDERLGKVATVKLAKIQYKLAKLDQIMTFPDELMFKRVKFVVEKKKILSEKLSDLLPRTRAEFGELSSSISDSSLDNAPRRPFTPVNKLTTLFASMLKGQGSPSKSPSNFGTSPPRPSNLRKTLTATLPSIKDFEIIKLISRGAFGNVFLAKKRTTNDLFAIKVMRKTRLIRKNMTSHILTERRVMSLVQAPFVVKLYYAFESTDHLFLVMEYLIGGDMSSVLMDRGRLTEEAARFYGAELVLALEKLHSFGIIHRDLKPDNILIDRDGHLKLSDFGLSKVLSSPTSINNNSDNMLGTPDYMAPEILKGEPHGTLADWWSLGVCLFEMLTGMPPFIGETPEELFEKILNFEKFNWSNFDEMISSPAQDLLDRLLNPNPSARLDSQLIKSHSFFHAVDWNNIRSKVAPIIPNPKDELDTSYFDARNQRYSSLGLPEDFMEAEPVEADCQTTKEPIEECYSSPFEGFFYKNVDLLGKINRTLTSTPISTVNSLDNTRSDNKSESDLQLP